MLAYVISENVQIPEYSGNIDERMCVYGDITAAIDAVRTMFLDKLGELEKEYRIISDSLFVSRSDGYCSGVIQYESIGMNENSYAWNISCCGYTVK